MFDASRPHVSIRELHGVIEVNVSADIPGPRDDVYGFWRDPQNMPRVIEHLDGVTVLDVWRSRWTVRDEAGAPLVFDCEIIAEVKNELIAWRCGAGAADAADCAFQVRFADAPGDRGTHMRIEVICGKLSPAARLLGDDPAGQVEGDVRRMVSALSAAASTSGEDADPVPLRPKRT